MTSIQEISNKTGITRTTLYNWKFHEKTEEEKIKALLHLAANNKDEAERLMEQRKKVRGLALIMATEAMATP